MGPELPVSGGEVFEPSTPDSVVRLDHEPCSDLIAIPFIVGLLAAVLVVMAGFFLAGAAVDFPILIITMCIVGYVAYRGLAGNGSK